ncbi:YciI family protein [Asanoa sp. WMMD1127]|uniref:YciI family protein n=1 Tax=Asanoa sp. WMMD1127 TaxID=3016107 RepID=UPI0024179EE2|nr:YciI family protein [Asanoa sp. WMMD1127]MDG4823207.1 YciI family protein [Asanoa sp. WMMD1127]
MRHYLLTVQQPGDGARLPPEELEPIIKDVEVVNEELRAAGAWVFAGGLHPPSTSTVVRLDGDEVATTDGPYAEGKEHVGGLTVLAAADLDEALGWARKFARATRLPIEVRPFHGDPGTHLP